MGVQHAVHTGLFGWALRKQAVAMAHYVARLDHLGVDFRFGSKKNTRDYYFKWDEIVAVRHKKAVDSTDYVVAQGQFFPEIYQVHLLSAKKPRDSDCHPSRPDNPGRQAVTP